MGYLSHFLKENPPPFRLEITLDSGAFSHEMRDVLRQTRDFFAQVQERTGWDAQVIQREPTQIFHEKTGFLSPELAPKDVSLWPERHQEIGREMQAGLYKVDAPGEVEKHYKDALRKTVFAIGDRGENAAMFNQQGIHKPADIDDTLMQTLFSTQTPFSDRQHKFRQTEEFRDFISARADSGERAMAEFTRNRPEPEEGQRVVAFFVSNDRGALREMKEAGQEASNRYPGKLQVQSLHREEVKDTLAELVKEVRRTLPECADIPFPPADNRFAQRVHLQRRQPETGSQSR